MKLRLVVALVGKGSQKVYFKKTTHRGTNARYVEVKGQKYRGYRTVTEALKFAKEFQKNTEDFNAQAWRAAHVGGVRLPSNMVSEV